MSKQDYPRRDLSSDDYPSDLWILEMFKGWYDPCPLLPKEDALMRNGLKTDWWNQRHIYVNPPYSEPHLWVEKALNELFKANMEGKRYTCVMLLKHDSSTRWFRALHEAGAHMMLISERLSFQTGRPCAFPSLMAVISNASE
tara:strand:- start:1469 stop:1894 length:426 start_codon:yes stop_codon:yes gene_type:complete